MRGKVDPLGKVLSQLGAMDEDSIQDVLMEQRQTLPFASLCYVLGHCPEEMLARALSKKLGIPGIALDSSVIGLSVLDGLDPDLSLTYNILPVYEDEKRLFVAVEEPQAVASVLREIAFMRGRTVVPHVAIHITLARTIRACMRARQRGESLVYGPLVTREVSSPWMAVVSEVEMREESRFDEQTDEDAAAARSVVIEDVTKEVAVDELLSMQELGTDVEVDESTSRRSPADLGGDRDMLADLRGPEHSALREGPARILIVDDDFASRHLLAKELAPEGYQPVTASSGGEAVRFLRGNPPDAVVLDVMLPEIDGFQICRAIKQSHRYQHIPVVLMSAVIDSGRVTDKVLRQYGADAYFEKPLNIDRVKARLRELVGQTSDLVDDPSSGDATFARALELYRSGDIDGAVQELRRGLDDDPLSAKHHFVLANLLQKQDLIYEAIDEYEATVDLRPDYFPALTRLAYLYYKKGFSAKAIETWRRSLPFCDDASLRENIELFMRKLIADMQLSVP